MRKWGRRGVLLSILLSLFLTGACREINTSVAEEAYADGNYRLAAEEYTRFIRENPKSSALPDAYLGLAWSTYKMGDYARSTQAVDVLLQRFPGSKLIPTARYVAALGYFAQRRYVEAEEELDDLILYYPNAAIIPEARFLRARAQAAMLRYAEAAESYKDYLKRYGNAPYAAAALLGRAEALLKSRRWKEAVGVYEDFLKRFPSHPDRPDVLFRLAQLYEANLLYEKGLEAYERFLSEGGSEGREREALEGKAHCLEGLQRFDEAAKVYRSLYTLAEDTDVCSAAGRLAAYYLSRGETETARDYYRRIVLDCERVPEIHAPALEWWVKDLLDRDRFSEAFEAAEKYVTLYPGVEESEKVERMLIDMLEKAGRTRDARDRLLTWIRRRFSRAVPNDFYRLASLDITLRDYDAALEDAQEGLRRARILEDTPAIKSGLYHQMIVYDLLKRPADVLTLWWELKEIDPQYLTPEETVYWDAIEKRFFEESQVPLEFRSPEKYRLWKKISFHLAGFVYDPSDSVQAVLATMTSRLLITHGVVDRMMNYTPAEKVRMLDQITARDDFDRIPDSWFPLRSTIGTDWIVDGRIWRDPSLDARKPIIFDVRLIRVTPEGLFPFRYRYHYAVEDVATAPPQLARVLTHRMKIYY